MTPPLPLEEAQRRLLAEVVALPPERVSAEQAIGRYLAEPMVAARTQPAADLSAMDGYAVRADDIAGPWRVVGESAAGHPYAGTLAHGEAIRIATGGLLPPGECAVLIQENAERESDRLRLAGRGGPAARHIRRAGFDFRMGDELLAAGERIGPAQLALALAAGPATLPVHRLPRVAVIDSGDELAPDPADCAQHRIPASNGAMLAAMAAPYAAGVLRLGPVADSLEALLAALESAGEADVIVTSGGASVGDRDLVRPALERWGATIDFWRVAIRPGKPLLVARKGRQWVLGLPGNPVSSYVTGFLFVLPLLRKLGGAGSDRALPSPIEAELGSALPAGGERREFLRARLTRGTVVALGEQDSSALRSLAAANALIERASGAPPMEPPQTVPVYLLENGGIA
jgi:molybdopterin molybdotransferase